MVSQKFNLIPYLTLLKNIQLAVYFAKNLRPTMNSDVQTLLNALQLPSNIMHRQVSQLSVGQQQRVAITRDLIIIDYYLLSIEHILWQAKESFNLTILGVDCWRT
jgi:ABC-type lipoprotein export system ATPase subunit